MEDGGWHDPLKFIACSKNLAKELAVIDLAA